MRPPVQPSRSRSQEPIAATDRESRRARFEEAKALAARGAHDRARAILDPMIAADPGDFDAWFVLARVRLAAGDRAEALAAVARAIAIRPKEKALALAARIEAERDSLTDALAQVEALASAHDFIGLGRLAADRAGAAHSLVAAIAEARLFQAHQCHAEAVAAADLALARIDEEAVPDADRDRLRFELETLRARALVTLGRAEEVRLTPDLPGPKPTSVLRRELDLWWRSDPARGLAAAEALVAAKRAPVRAQVLACMLALAENGPERAHSTARRLLADAAEAHAEPATELLPALARLAQEEGEARAATAWFARFFGRFALEAPPTLWQPGFGFDDLELRVPMLAGGPLVTVIVTAFNAAHTLATAIRSLTGQSHPDLEILVVDDASSDGTLAAARALAAEDPRVRVIANADNVGTYVAKNRALEQARGEFYTILDADDWAHPRRIERHLALHRERPELAVSGSDWVRLTPEGWPAVRPSIGVYTHRNPGSAFMRVADMRDVLGAYEAVRIDADHDHWLRAHAAFGPARIARIREPLTLGRHHDASLTRSGAGAQDGELYAPVRSAYRARALAWRLAGKPLRIEPGAAPRFPEIEGLLAAP